MKPASLMTQYQNGQLATRDLQQMMVDYAADARFDREMHDDIDLYTDSKDKKGCREFGSGYDPRVHQRLVPS